MSELIRYGLMAGAAVYLAGVLISAGLVVYSMAARDVGDDTASGCPAEVFVSEIDPLTHEPRQPETACEKIDKTAAVWSRVMSAGQVVLGWPVFLVKLGFFVNGTPSWLRLEPSV